MTLKVAINISIPESKKGKMAQRLMGGSFLLASPEVVHVTSTHVLLASSHSYDHY